MVKKKPFWKLSKQRNNTTLKPVEAAPANGTLRSLFMDDTALSRSMRRSSLTDFDVGVPKFRRPLRESRSICVPSAAEQAFLREINIAGLSTQTQEGENSPANSIYRAKYSLYNLLCCRDLVTVSRAFSAAAIDRREARKATTTGLDQLARAAIDWVVDWTNACQRAHTQAPRPKKHGSGISWSSAVDVTAIKAVIGLNYSILRKQIGKLIHDIHVWHQHQLFRVNRVFKEGQSNESEFLKKLFAILLPKEPLPVDITSAFQVLDERLKSFRPIHPNEIFSNGSLLKLLCSTKAESNPRRGSGEACILSQQRCSVIYQGNETSDVRPAPLLGRKYSNSIVGAIEKQEKVEGKTKVEKEKGEESKSNSPSSPDIMQSQIPSGGAPTRLPIHPTLIPATMQVGSNGERHLILHYPDGHTVATTALPNQSGQFHLVPLLNQPQAQTSQTTLRLIQTAPDFSHTKRQPLGMNLEAHTHLVKKKSGQKVELVCTCPPELHHVLRQSQMESTSQVDRPGDGDSLRWLKNTSRAGLSCVGWANSTPQTDLLTSSSGESSETFQESDSSGGSCQTNTFSTIRKGMIPPDVLLASVLNAQRRRPTKPPQTLEEAQHRIAYMENQLTQLTAWIRAVQTQGGLEGDSSKLVGIPGRSPPEHYTSGLAIKDNDSAAVESKCLFAHCSSGYERCPRPPSPPYPHQSNCQRLLNACKGLKDLRLDLHGLKQTHAANTRQMRNISNSIVKEIIQLLSASKSKGATPVRLVQLSLDSHMADYKADRKEIEAWLKDLDACIEEMRVDALNRRCRVSVAEVEAYALHLSRLSQRLASFKGHIPEICNALNLLTLVNEAEVKVQNELLLDEQKRIDVTLSTCKQLTCTLFTLKRLAAVQENGISVNIPTFRTIRDPRPEDKKLYLQQISKIVPNHEARMLGLARHEKTRERRKRMLSLHESVYLERAMEQSESNLQEILQRLNELSLDLLSSSPEQSEEEGPNQAPSFTSTPSSLSRICPIHQAGVKAAETCCNHCEVINSLRSGKSCRGSGDGESSTSPSSASSEQNVVGAQLPLSAPPLPPSLPQAPRGPRRAHVVFSRTVLVDAGRETTRLNCPSDLDDDHLDDAGDTGSEAEEPQLWRRERLHRGNRVVDIHPGLPRNEYVICDGRCGASSCAQGSCLARQKGSTGSVLKTTTAYGSSPNDSNPVGSQSASASDFDSKSVDSEESEKQPAEPTSVHEMRTHHQCCRLNNPGNLPSTN
ncbi:Coiled-coil domain-containing protein [Echinococcus granulosus]|uniref:Coiled-coil domain-containing protein n=1 Tax=Echinococcus granulosus TaxID=6210 RepID=W6VBN3_ECHGR|nr:Coiled-coil domain-containing protein [Echinococcus granulosus]EUB64249.1 Coiled-coil domain-containing protein [Echinococcus granulosus]